MRTFKQHLNEGQLTVDMKKMTSKDRKEFIALAQSLKIKRKFDLSFASVSLGRWLNLKAYYLDLNDFIAYITDKGYKYRNQAGITKNIAKRLGNPEEIVMENLEEAKKPGKGEAKIEVTWDHGKPDRGDVEDWSDLGVYLVKVKRNELELEGEKENLVTWLWDFYGWDMKDIEREYKELFR